MNELPPFNFNFPSVGLGQPGFWKPYPPSPPTFPRDETNYLRSFFLAHVYSRTSFTAPLPAFRRDVDDLIFRLSSSEASRVHNEFVQVGV